MISQLAADGLGAVYKLYIISCTYKYFCKFVFVLCIVSINFIIIINDIRPKYELVEEKATHTNGGCTIS